MFAVFESSLYVRFADGGLVCVGFPSIGHGPLNLTTAFTLDFTNLSSRVPQGADARMENAVLSIPGLCRIDVSRATLWRPPPVVSCAPAVMRARLAELIVAVHRRDPASGFAPLLPDLAIGRRELFSCFGDPVLVRAAPAIGRVAEWLAQARNDPEVPPPSLVPLIGFGWGLTPSGDDFLAGAMVALSAFGRRDLVERLVAALPPKPDTNEISLAHLRCAVMGEAGEALMGVLAALGHPAPQDFDACVGLIDRVGHSSGWDGLAGAVAVCVALCRDQPSF